LEGKRRIEEGGGGLKGKALESKKYLLQQKKGKLKP